ncbi:helix-turn-helix domain-containing protein [Streptomyces sp. NBC_00257]|uniref:helix-turn-helix domain-containing protein n=1 Tax=unclassified Streptomyces TaxID=2593676 RepID=UPI002250CB41|nr:MULTISPECIES: helix-turn-helix domain-containing protein [unclassified Streptomyces]WTB54714.1 helix-turn-helix domain-containing protein [Streptomyces sp. NBC_00826]WTH92399.1 helix-turn-helix domain-containing protein [Streptomyces sp. NBC_00825]WTI01129.1 helix-turn-helix domain-containing protein [Streptomyces sp. NBC_00822]MCX4866708.1 helix-turn-helix domain-containing protein [Streptomyces sp. NBC_00906]MCX4897946.1 helix-turn-helix domain-containing protein [Streptomyces sp. NBC_008
MDTPQITAPSRGPSPVPGDATPSSGVIHINFRHAAGFTVIGNHLAQHRGLSLAAIGLAAHIQSLPAGARIGIKRLAERFPESETRIAAALRELEAHGYLHRSRIRLADGRIVTRTVSYNQPGTTAHPSATPRPRKAPSKPTPQPAPPPPPHATAPQPHPAPAPAPPPTPTPQPPAPQPQPTPVLVPAPTARTTPPPPLPQPQELTPELQRAATALLADLRRHAPQLTLSEHDIHTLAPGIATWLERDAHPDTIRHTLTTDLPSPLKHPAKLLRHRITTLLPPPLPGTQDIAALARPGVIVIPLQNCDGCDRAYRSRHPGHCRDCRTDLHAAA